MNETIRQHFARVQKYLKWSIVVAFSAMVLALTFYFPHASLGQSFLRGLGIVLVVGLPALVFTSRTYKCPRCRASFRKLRMEQLGFSADPRMYWELWNECPRCHLSFDDPWP